MTTFGVGAEVDITVPDSELRAARAKVEDELGGAAVSVDAQSAGGGSNRLAGRERAMQRSLLSDQTDVLATLSEHSDQNLTLDETRNDLLRALIEETESQTFTQAKSGGGLGSGSAVGGLLGAIGGLGIAGVIGSRLSDALGNIDPPSITPDINPISASEVIADTVSVDSVLTGTAAVDDYLTGSITPTELVVGTVAASTIISGNVAAANLITGTVGASGLISGTVGAADLIAGTESAPNLISGSEQASKLIAGTTAASGLISGNIAAPNLISGAVNIADLIETGSGGGGESSGGGIGAPEVVAGGAGALAAGGILRGLSQGMSSTAPAGSAIAPLLAGPMAIAQSEQRREQGRGGVLERLLPDLPQRDRTRTAMSRETPTASNTERISARDRRDSRGNTTEVTNNVTVEGMTERETERLIERHLKDFRRELERDLS